MANQEQLPAPDPEDEGEESENKTEGKQGFIKKLLGIKLFGNKKLLLIAGGGTLVLLLGLGAGAFFLFSGSAEKTAEAEAPVIPATPPKVAYFDLPDLIVNIQTSDGSAAYLKLSVSLELFTEEEKAGLQALTPRIVDQFQGYLRELRADDLKGSAGVMRIKEELLRRTNVAAVPYRVRDVLLKEMIIQ